MDAREPCQDREGAAISGSVRVPQIHLLMDCRLSKDVFFIVLNRKAEMNL